MAVALQSSIFVVWKTCKLCHEFIDACKFSFMFFCIKNDVSKEGGEGFPLFIFPTRWQVFPHCVLGFATYQKKQLDYNSMTKPFIIVVCQNSLMISSKAMREWARKIVVILYHTKDIRKLSYEKEKARNSVQWYGIYDQWVPRELFSVSFIALRTRICESLKMPRMSSHLMWQIDNDLYKAAQLFWADRL